MMKQYLAIRKDLPANSVLLFRLGDFYEMFGDDAKLASPILNVALTKRGDLPMCGVPFHSARNYIAKLVEAGYRVAICDQVGEVQAGKLVRRELTEIISAGTLDSFGLDDRSPNYLAAICPGENGFGVASCELSTGEFRLTEVADESALSDELARISPAEILVPEAAHTQLGSLAAVSRLDDYLFSPDQATEVLRSHFKVHSLDGFGCSDLPTGICAAGALMHYVTFQLRRNASHLRSLSPYRTSEYLILDASTQTHLEIVQSRGGRAMSLLGALDRTVTPMGARTLRDWLLHPLCSPAVISARQDVVAGFLAKPIVLADLRESLAAIRDLERGLARLNGTSGNARDLAALATSLEAVPPVLAHIARLTTPADTGPTICPDPDQPIPPLLQTLADSLDPLPELSARLHAAIVDEPPGHNRDGGFIRDGFDEGLDEIRSASRDGKSWVARLQDREIERTGIKSLKVRFTSVFGYFIEITKANLSSVPDDYIRKQTTANGERFITPELKEIEGRILGADERAKSREAEIFAELRSECLARTAAIQQTASALGAIDTLAAFAETARQRGYARPVVDDSSLIKISEGRHPVLDAAAGGEKFVPNDTDLDADFKRFAIITGPNMAGKSTYLRQVALLVLLAQTGSFVPAASAHIGVVDRIFTRVGASDDLSRGQSTFMVEMNETASILHNATASSLVILDEIGRGTSTFDGLSIAWSVAEYLHDHVACRTLFATHYHEMTDLEKSRSGVVNWNVAVREWNDQVIFLRKIIPGRADQSYGIQVARLAGLPESVLARAKEILANLERSELNADGEAAFAKARRKNAATRDTLNQLNLL
ncbi:MAG: DNA mismatch repair protein MutS [Terrimicrobiaceae bacterium]